MSLLRPSRRPGSRRLGSAASGLVALIAVLWTSSATATTTATTTTAITTPSLQLDQALLLDIASLAARLETGGARGVARLTGHPLQPSMAEVVTVGRRSALPRQIPGHFAWVERDTRAFWYAAGMGAVTTLGSHVLFGLPTLAISASLMGPILSHPAVLGIMVGTFIGYTVAEASLSALVSMLVFDSMSETYESHFLTGFLAHAGAGVAATAVTTLTIGGGLLLFHGLNLIAEFTGGAGIEALVIFSFLGAMPAVVVAGTALVAVPALATAWALAAGATPRPGYAVDEEWLATVDDPTRRRGEAVGGGLRFAFP